MGNAVLVRSAETRLAVVGAGDIGRRHMQAIRAAGSTTLAAVVDPVLISPNHDAPHFADIRSMLNDVVPDGIIIAAPNDQHVALAEVCIEHGIPTLVEKPISNSIRSAYGLADLSEERNVPILVGHHRRHNPLIQRARAILQGGALGAITAVSATWLVRKPQEYFAVQWRTENGGGPILINLIHDVDSLRYLVGEVVSVLGVSSKARRGLQVEDTAAAILTFANGAVATIVLSDFTPSPWSWELTAGETTSYAYPRVDADCYQIAGTLASMAVPSLRIWRHDGAQSWQSPLVAEDTRIEPADSLVNQIRHFVDVITGTAVPIITARDAAKTLEVTLAITEAARTRSAVDISGGNTRRSR